MPPFACQRVLRRASRQIHRRLSISARIAAGAGRSAARSLGRRMGIADDRLTTLEIRAAEQEKTIEDLSGQIAEQWKTIEALRKKLDALTDRFLALEEHTAPEVPVT